MSNWNDGRTYKVDCYIVPVREVAVAVHGQERVALDLGIELGRELLRRDLSHDWLAIWDLHVVVGVVSHLELS